MPVGAGSIKRASKLNTETTEVKAQETGVVEENAKVAAEVATKEVGNTMAEEGTVANESGASESTKAKKAAGAKSASKKTTEAKKATKTKKASASKTVGENDTNKSISSTVKIEAKDEKNTMEDVASAEVAVLKNSKASQFCHLTEELPIHLL